MPIPDRWKLIIIIIIICSVVYPDPHRISELQFYTDPDPCHQKRIILLLQRYMLLHGELYVEHKQHSN